MPIYTHIYKCISPGGSLSLIHHMKWNKDLLSTFYNQIIVFVCCFLHLCLIDFKNCLTKLLCSTEETKCHPCHHLTSPDYCVYYYFLFFFCQSLPLSLQSPSAVCRAVMMDDHEPKSNQSFCLLAADLVHTANIN